MQSCLFWHDCFFFCPIARCCLKTLKEGTTTYKDSGLKANTKYQYRIAVTGAVKKDGVTTSTGVKSATLSVSTSKATTIKAQATSIGGTAINLGIYTVSFDAGSGTGSMESATVSVLFETDAVYTLPECSFTHPDGLSFVSWNIDGEDYLPGARVTILDDVVVTATWATETAKADTYLISFDANGGIGSMDSVSVESEDEWTIPQSNFTPPTGKAFKAWYVNGKEYIPGDDYTDVITSNLTATALWTNISSVEMTYDVSFAANGGTGEMASVTIIEGEEYSIPDSTFNPPDGMVFDGWMIDQEVYTPGESIVVLSDVIISAIWKISIVSTDGPQLLIADQTASAGATIDVPVFLKNNPGVCSFSFALEYDAEKLEYIGATDADYAGLASTISANDNRLGFGYASASTSNLTGEKIANLQFRVKAGVSGEAVLSIIIDEDFEDGFIASDESTGNTIPVSVMPVGGRVKISTITPGDVDGNGRVNNEDLLMLTRYRARWKVSPIMDNADVDGNGRVNNEDLLLLTRYRARWKVTLLPGKVTSGATATLSSAEQLPIIQLQEASDSSSQRLIMQVERDSVNADEYNAQIALVNNPGIISFSFAVEYDDSKLEYVGATDGDYSGLASTVSSNGNLLGFGFASASHENLTEADIATLKFKVKPGASGIAQLK